MARARPGMQAVLPHPGGPGVAEANQQASGRALLALLRTGATAQQLRHATRPRTVCRAGPPTALMLLVISNHK
jgi:hypothetical protein